MARCSLRHSAGTRGHDGGACRRGPHTRELQHCCPTNFALHLKQRDSGRFRRPRRSRGHAGQNTGSSSGLARTQRCLTTLGRPMMAIFKGPLGSSCLSPSPPATSPASPSPCTYVRHQWVTRSALLRPQQTYAATEACHAKGWHPSLKKQAICGASTTMTLLPQWGFSKPRDVYRGDTIEGLTTRQPDKTLPPFHPPQHTHARPPQSSLTS